MSLRSAVGLVGALALAAVLISLWAAIQAAKTEAAFHVGRAGLICAAAGADYREVSAKGELLPHRHWGRACKAAVEGLAKFKADALQGANQVLIEHVQEQAQKRTADADLARQFRERKQRAEAQMEAANATREGNRLGSDALAALNALGGLRGPIGPDAGAADGDRPAGEGEPAQ